jgi:hypothetical protein
MPAFAMSVQACYTLINALSSTNPLHKEIFAENGFCT